MSKRLKRRTSALLLASLLAISSVPMTSSLSVYADEYIGNGGDTNGGTGLINNGLNTNGYGIRIYAIDQYGNIKTGTGGQYIVDLWDNYVMDKLSSAYRYDTLCRFGNASGSGVYATSFSGGINTATKYLKEDNLIPNDTTFSHMPKFAGFSGSNFYMTGDTFKTWATASIQSNTQRGSNWQVTLLYYGLTGIALESTDYLVMEPMLYIPVDYGKWGSSVDFRGYAACTWYGFLNILGNHSGSGMSEVKKTWGNGFKLNGDIAGLAEVNSNYAD